MSALIMVMGIPGADKSTYIKHLMQKDEVYVSRDEIRFSIVKEGEEYFSKETEVFNQFIATINEALEDDKVVWADATHLNEKSRLKVLNALKVRPDLLEIIWIDTDLNTAIEQNNLRKGTRAFVPPSVIRRMSAQLRKPKFHEGNFTFDVIGIKRSNQVIELYETEEDMREATL